MQANVAVLDDGLVSGQHARITRASGGYDIEDLGSKNGTFVDNVRIEGRLRLRDGALVFIGNHVGVFRLVSAIELDAIKAELVAPLGPVATASPALAVACDRLRRLAASEGELFIVGETGVGKEVYARAVHEASGRKGRFVAINCAAIPRELVESELFGYRAGAHSTAHQAKAGPDRGGRGRHAVPRRDRRDDARGADQDPALPAGPRADAAGLDAAAAHGRAHHRRDQPRDRGRRQVVGACATTSSRAWARRPSTCRRCATASRTSAR